MGMLKSILCTNGANFRAVAQYQKMLQAEDANEPSTHSQQIRLAQR